MHELSIASAVLDVALRSASGRPVSAVRLRAGALRQVVPDSVQFYWEFVTRETLCEGSELDVVEVPAVLACRDCGSESELELPIFRCAHCAGADVAVVCGEELEVEYVEVVDAGDAIDCIDCESGEVACTERR